jgi:hypothetical protein
MPAVYQPELFDATSTPLPDLLGRLEAAVLALGQADSGLLSDIGIGLKDVDGVLRMDDPATTR